MKKKIIYLFVLIVLVSSNSQAQFPIKIPKIGIPKVEQPKTDNPAPTSRSNSSNETNDPVGQDLSNKNNSTNSTASNRQFVMDDGFTFFDAEPVKGRNPKNTGDIDVGWKLKPDLRLMGTFPDNSGFRLVVKKDGKEVGKFFCSSYVIRKDSDPYLSSGKLKATHDDYMFADRCSEPATPLKTLGWHDVEIFYVDGKTDAEKLVRHHKIDVHRAEQIKGHKGNEYAGVSEYYIERYAENAVGFIFAGSGSYGIGNKSAKVYDTFDPQTVKPLHLYMPIVPTEKTNYKSYLRCSVNGQIIKLPYDTVEMGRTSGSGTFAESALLLRNDPKFTERITFGYLKASLPLSVGGVRDRTTNISESPGRWECKIAENGETYRIVRFEVGPDGKIGPHPEQQNGNVNLFEKTYLVDVEIPANSSIDERSLPMPEAGLFYGIPWSTAEGKAAAKRVPKKGIPYPVIPN